MKAGKRSPVGPPTTLVARLGADKKKIVVAACLISVMGIMWLRVMLKKGPEAAAAMPGDTQVASKAENPAPQKIEFIELPKIEGRNDKIARNVFSANGWQGLGKSQAPANPADIGVVGGEPDVAETIRRLAATMKLEAIGLGNTPQAVINGKPLSVGDKLLVGEGKTKLECEVTEILETSVTLKCAKAVITLKLAQTLLK